MESQGFPGIYVDYLPTGEYAYSHGDVVRTHLGSILSPSNEDWMMFNRVISNPFKILSKGHQTDRLLMWNGQWTPLSINGQLAISHGSQGHGWKPDGTFSVIRPAANQESQGLRYYDPFAPPNIANADVLHLTSGWVTGSPSVNPFTHLAQHYGVKNLWEWTLIDGIIVGQGNNGGTIIHYQGNYYLLYPDKVSDIVNDDSRYIQFHKLNDLISVAVSDFAHNKVVLKKFSVSEITSLPLISSAPIPIPVPVGEPMIRAFERPLWQAPYFSHHTRYGDTELSKHVGNAITVIGDDSNIERFNNLNMPLIVAANVPNPTFNLDLTVAWLVHGGTVNETVQNANDALQLPEKPVIAYHDGREWPNSDPFFNDRIWPSIQAYRGPNEPLDLFGVALTTIIERVSSYGRPMCLVPRFDDFNGSSTISRTLECMHLYEQWLREFNFVACMPFSDRRGNGISKNKSLWDWARAFQYAIPFERPNRFDYWRPSSSSIISILNNKFGQTRASIVLEPYLRGDILSKYSNSEPEPEPEPGDIEGIENGMVVNPEKFFMSLVRNKRPQDFELVMREIEKIFYKYGFGHQCRSDCVPRGRIFMPHASARNVAPDISIEREKCLGVTQRIGSAAWAHQVNIVNHPPTQWVWDDMGGPEYVPYKPV